MNNSTILQIITEDDELFQFETTTNFAGTNSSTITTYPTSEGTPRTDNIYNNPNKLNCTVNIGGDSTQSDMWGSGAEKPKLAMAELERWKDNAVKLTILTPQKDYYNMFLTSINNNATTTNAFNLAANLQFDELYIVNYETVVVTPEKCVSFEISANDTTTTDNKNEKNFGSFLASGNGGLLQGITGDGLKYAAVGAVAGSIIPGIGTAVGATLGVAVSGIVGCVKGIVNWFKGD